MAATGPSNSHQDDTTVLSIDDEPEYRDEVTQLMRWYNSLALNVSKTKERIVDFRKHRGTHSAHQLSQLLLGLFGQLLDFQLH